MFDYDFDYYFSREVYEYEHAIENDDFLDELEAMFEKEELDKFEDELEGIFNSTAVRHEREA